MVVHPAARVGITGTAAEFASVNVDGTANVVASPARPAQGCRGTGVVQLSSPSVGHRGRPLLTAAAPAAVVEHPAPYPATKAQVGLLSGPTDIVTAIRAHQVWGPPDT